MKIKIYFKVNINTVPLVITFKNQQIDYEKEQYIEQTLNYPNENQISFNVANIEGGSSDIEIIKITLNGMEVNKYHNTSFKMCGNRYVEEKTLTSISKISFNGTYKLCIDNLYIRSCQSQHWHCSTYKEDFVFQYEFTQDSFKDEYRDRNHVGFEKEFIPCFGCSFTYGAAQPADAAWPFLLNQKLKKKILNLGVGGAGFDAIYNNLKLLYKEHKFKQCLILFPNFERRLVRCKIDQLWFKIPSTVNIKIIENNFCFYNHPVVEEKMELVQRKIIKDIKNRYSRKILSKIINFCSNNHIKLYASSWQTEVYDHLKTYNNLVLLPQFPKLNTFNERAEDGRHPHRKHYQYFVDQINL